MLKVEQRRKEALARTNENGTSSSSSSSALENSLQDVVSRYSFMDLWPCSSKELDHLSRQDWLSSNGNKKLEKPPLVNPSDKTPGHVSSNFNLSSKVIYPDTSRMVVYDPTNQKPGIITTPVLLPSISATLPSSSVPPLATGGPPPVPNLIPKSLPPALSAFLASLPAAVVDGPVPDVDYVISICLQSNLPIGEPASSDNKFKPRDRQQGKRKDADRQEEDESNAVQSQQAPKDAFKIRQMRKSRVGAVSYGSVQTGSASYGSGFSGEHSGSFG